MIRQATPDDAAELHDLARATFPLACPPHTTPEAIAAHIAEHLSIIAFEGYLADANRDLFVSDRGDQLEGYTMVAYGDPSDADVAACVVTRPTAELSKMYTRPERHGSGLARELVEASVAAAVARGAVSVWLGVNQENERANRFYEKCGFVLVGTKRFKVGERFEDDFVRELFVLRDRTEGAIATSQSLD